MALPNGTLVIKDNMPLTGNPMMTRLDGEERAPLEVLLSTASTALRRAAFGVYIVDTTPPDGQRWAGTFAYNAPVFENLPPPTAADVVRERERRLASGFDYDFGDARGVHHIGTTADDMAGWEEVTMGANAAIALGAGSSAFNIVTETGPVEVTALGWQSILLAATAFRQPIWSASFVLQTMEPIPADYKDDGYWP